MVFEDVAEEHWADVEEVLRTGRITGCCVYVEGNSVILSIRGALTDTSGDSKPKCGFVARVDKGKDVLRVVCDDMLTGLCDIGSKSRSELPRVTFGEVNCLLGVITEGFTGVTLGVLTAFAVLAATNFSVSIYSSTLPMDSFLVEV